MRFLADECLLGEIVRELRKEGYDLANVPRSLEGADDDEILEHSVVEGRVLLTQDYGFGDLATRLRRPAIGIVIVAEDSFSGTFEDIAAQVVKLLGELGDGLIGRLTMLSGDRTRSRPLSNPVLGRDTNEQ